MLAGNLRHRVTVEKLVKEQDPNTGRMTEIWQNFGTFYANFTELSSRDLIIAKGSQSQITARMVVRYDSRTVQIDSTYRVFFREHYWAIEGDPIRDNETGLEWLTFNLKHGDPKWGG